MTGMKNELMEAMVNAGYTMEEKDHPTLKAIAETMGIPAQRLYNVGKRPVPGEIFEVGKINWAALNAFVLKRLGADNAEIKDMAELISKAKELDEKYKAAGVSRGRRAAAPAKDDIIFEDGTSTPARKVEIALGQRVMIRGEKKGIVYTVVYETPAGLCLQEEKKPLLKAMGNWTANQKLILDETKFDKIIADRAAAEEQKQAVDEAE